MDHMFVLLVSKCKYGVQSQITDYEQQFVISSIISVLGLRGMEEGGATKKLDPPPALEYFCVFCSYVCFVPPPPPPLPPPSRLPAKALEATSLGSPWPPDLLPLVHTRRDT